jgi:hypothetical protein
MDESVGGEDVDKDGDSVTLEGFVEHISEASVGTLVDGDAECRGVLSEGLFDDGDCEASVDGFDEECKVFEGKFVVILDEGAKVVYDGWIDFVKLPDGMFEGVIITEGMMETDNDGFVVGCCDNGTFIGLSECSFVVTAVIVSDDSVVIVSDDSVVIVSDDSVVIVSDDFGVVVSVDSVVVISVGTTVGELVGRNVGNLVGDTVGAIVGFDVGVFIFMTIFGRPDIIIII